MAAIKVPLIADLLARFAEVKIIATDASRKLIPAEFLAGTAISIAGVVAAVKACQGRAVYKVLVGDRRHGCCSDSPQVMKRNGGVGSEWATLSCTLN